VAASRVLGVAAAVGAVLYVMLDSGIIRPEGTPKVMSVTLIVLALVFTLGTWTASFGGQPNRQPMMAGLALGLAAYAVLRLVAF
jgi:drug/metabolite transporter (DMT)-like permease